MPPPGRWSRRVGALDFGGYSISFFGGVQLYKRFASSVRTTRHRCREVMERVRGRTTARRAPPGRLTPSIGLHPCSLDAYPLVLLFGWSGRSRAPLRRHV